MLHNVTKTRSTLHNATAINWSQTNSSWTLWHEQEHLCTFGHTHTHTYIRDWVSSRLFTCVCVWCMYLPLFNHLATACRLRLMCVHTCIHTHTYIHTYSYHMYTYLQVATWLFSKTRHRPRLPSITCCIVRWARLVIVTLLYFDFGYFGKIFGNVFGNMFGNVFGNCDFHFAPASASLLFIPDYWKWSKRYTYFVQMCEAGGGKRLQPHKLHLFLTIIMTLKYM